MMAAMFAEVVVAIALGGFAGLLGLADYIDRRRAMVTARNGARTKRR